MNIERKEVSHSVWTADRRSDISCIIRSTQRSNMHGFWFLFISQFLFLQIFSGIAFCDDIIYQRLFQDAVQDGDSEVYSRRFAIEEWFELSETPGKEKVGNHVFM